MITIKRCREFVTKCKSAGKLDEKAKAIQFLLKVIDGEDAKRKAIPVEEMTIEQCEQWLSRWGETPRKSIPFAVKALDYTLGVLAFERDQQQAFVERLGGCIGNMVDSTKMIKEHFWEHKRTGAFMYRLSSNRRSETFLKTEKD